MGLFSNIIAYKIGKSRGKRASKVVLENDGRDPECLDYESFCKNFGSCDGQKCDYDDDEFQKTGHSSPSSPFPDDAIFTPFALVNGGLV